MRPFRLLAVAICIVPGALQGQDNPVAAEGEALLQEFLNRVARARALDVRSAWEARHGKDLCVHGTGVVAGSLAAEDGDLSLDWKFETEHCRVCGATSGRGASSVTCSKAQPPEQRRKHLAQVALGMDPLVSVAARAVRGRVGSFLVPCTRSEARLGPLDTVQGRETRVLEYTLTDYDGDAMRYDYDVRLWIDLRTRLPVQRTASLRGTTMTLRETFTTFTLTDGPAPEKR